MLDQEVLEIIKKEKIKHKHCCYFKDGRCIYFQNKVNPNSQACTIFLACEKCSKIGVKKWCKNVGNK